MALVTAQGISSLMVPLLRRMLVLPNTVSRPPGGEFAGDNGDTISIRVRQPRTANIQATPGAAATFTSINETSVDVSMVHLYDGVNITDEELSLELVDFASQVTEPQLASVATGAEDEAAGAMNDVVADHADLTLANLEGYIIEAREALSAANVPPGDRFAAASPTAVSLLLGIENFVRVDQSGSDSALREAVVGRLFGFTFVESNGLTGGAVNNEAIVFYHRSGFAFANRAPVAPRGAAQSAAVSDSGIGMRQVFQYNPSVLTDQSVVSTFAGAALVDANRVFKIQDADV